MLNFLRQKLALTAWSDLIFSQFEGLVFWLTGSIPGALGFILRAVACKLLFKRLDGFCWIQPGVTIVHANRLTVGKHFGCNTGTYINALGGITLGDYVLLGSNVTISAGMHDIQGRLPPVFARPAVPKAIAIEDDVWIGAGAVILPGVRLRKGTVIGANSVVTSDTDEYGVYAGAPARKIRSR